MRVNFLEGIVLLEMVLRVILRDVIRREEGTQVARIVGLVADL